VFVNTILDPNRKEDDIMTAKLHKLLGTAMLGLVLLSQSLPAWAGDVDLNQVSVGSSTAYGTMAGARYSGDNKQFIGCIFSNTNGPYVLCSATDNTGKSLVCYGIGSQYTAAAKSITDFSYIQFSNQGGSCLSLYVGNSSAYLR